MSDESPDRLLEPGRLRAALDHAFVTGDFREALDRVGAEDLTLDEFRRQISSSDAAREHFNRLAHADRALAEAPPLGDADGSTRDSSFERRFEEALLDAALELPADEPGRSRAASESGSGDETGSADVVELFGPNARWGAVAAVAVLTIGLGYFYIKTGPPPAPNDSSFQSRSATSDEPGSDELSPRVRIFCVRRSDDGAEISGASQSPDEPLHCPIEAELKFAYDNPTSHHQYAAFFGVGEDGDVYWYGPSPADEAPVEIDPSTDKPRPIGETIRLEVNHDPGRIRVYGLFSTRPVPFERLSTLVESHRRALVDAPGELDVPDGRVDHVPLEIEEVTP